MDGKRKCEMLRQIRSKIAERYGLRYSPIICNNEGDCMGTCPLCDNEMADFQRQLAERGITNVPINEEINREVDNFYNDEHSLTDDDSKNHIGEDIRINPESPIMHDPNDPTQRPMMMLMEYFIARVQYYDTDEVWDKLKKNVHVYLERDYDNIHDKEAVKVMYHDKPMDDEDEDDYEHFQLGYLPQNRNHAISTLLNMGWYDLLDCRITEASAKSNGMKLIKIAINLKNINRIYRNDSKYMYRAIYIENEEYKELRTVLNTKGYIYYRWGGFPLEELNLPNEGDRIFFIYRKDNVAVVYLMKVIAKHNKCALFLTIQKIYMVGMMTVSLL